MVESVMICTSLSMIFLLICGSLHCYISIKIKENDKLYDRLLEIKTHKMKLNKIDTMNGNYLELLAETIQDQTLIEELKLALSRDKHAEIIEFLEKLNWK